MTEYSTPSIVPEGPRQHTCRGYSILARHGFLFCSGYGTAIASDCASSKTPGKSGISSSGDAMFAAQISVSRFFPNGQEISDPESLKSISVSSLSARRRGNGSV